MSAAEASIYKLRLDGATDAQLRQARALAHQVDQLERAKDAKADEPIRAASAGAALQGSREAHAIETRFKLDSQTKAIWQ